MSLQAHVDHDVAVVLVVVGDVEHQHRPPDGIGRPHTGNRAGRHGLIEGRIGGCRVHSVALGERVVQRLHERGFVRDLFVIHR
jgi:hypothetical protein